MSTEQDAHLVEVQIPHCSASDAAAVFAVLRAAFPRSPEPGRGETVSHGAEDERRIWLGTVDTSAHDEARSDVSLSRTTEIDLSGSPDAVRRVRDTLTGFFEVTEEPRISGDQEVEVRLRLARP